MTLVTKKQNGLRILANLLGGLHLLAAVLGATLTGACDPELTCAETATCAPSERDATGGHGGSAGKVIDGGTAGSDAVGGTGSGSADAAGDGSDAGSIDSSGRKDATDVDVFTMNDVRLDVADATILDASGGKDAIGVDAIDDVVDADADADATIVDTYVPPPDRRCTAGPTCTLDGKVQSCPDDGGPAVITSCPTQTPYCIGAGQCVACTNPTQCPTPANECLASACSANQCGTTPVGANTPLVQQTAGDCKIAVCNGSGSTTTIADTNDLPVDGNACTKDICTGDVPSNPPEMEGTSCASGLCLGGQCVPISTSNATSCQTSGAGRTNCGPNGNENCCKSLVVPGGSFYRNYDASTFPDMNAPATVSDFRLDAFEVTVGRFHDFVNSGKASQVSPPAAGAGAHPKIANSGWNPAWNSNLVPGALNQALKCDPTLASWTDLAGANDNRPVNCVTWYEAFAFCAADGGRLPTEAEWNYAAAGGDQQRQFAWGANFPDYNADYAAWGCYYGGGSGGDEACVSIASLAPVGVIPAGNGRWGHSDLAGNVYEWNLDWIGLPQPTPCVDCAQLTPNVGTTSTQRTLRGGDFSTSNTLGLLVAIPTSAPPSGRLVRQGIRCARSL
jgi:formylglycine-generating enzyme required for sulfatase activity